MEQSLCPFYICLKLADLNDTVGRGIPACPRIQIRRPLEVFHVEQLRRATVRPCGQSVIPNLPAGRRSEESRPVRLRNEGSLRYSSPLFHVEHSGEPSRHSPLSFRAHWRVYTMRHTLKCRSQVRALFHMEQSDMLLGFQSSGSQPDVLRFPPPFDCST